MSNDMQLCFLPDKETTDAIFIMQQVQEKHQAKKKMISEEWRKLVGMSLTQMLSEMVG